MSLIKRGKLVINTAGFVKNSLTQQTVMAVWRCAFDAWVKLPATGTKTSHSATGGLQAYRHSAQGHNVCVTARTREKGKESWIIVSIVQACHILNAVMSYLSTRRKNVSIHRQLHI